MELVFLILLLCVLLVFNWRFLGFDKLLGGGGRRATSGVWGKPCRWRRDASQKGGSLTRYVCAECGVDAYTSEARAPRRCLRGARPGSL